jgi:hypothetical protein
VKVWKIALRLAWFTLRGRGGWDVYLWLEHEDVPDGPDADAWAIMRRADWRLTDWNWVGGGDRYVTLLADPESPCDALCLCHPVVAGQRGEA